MKIQISFRVFKIIFGSYQQILKLKKKNYNKQSSKNMLKKILAKYLSMVIIYQEKNIIKHAKHIQASNNNKKLIEEEKKEAKQNTSYMSVLF